LKIIADPDDLTANKLLLEMVLLPLPAKMRSRVPPAWVGSVCALGVLLAFTFFILVRGWERRAQEAAAAELVRQQIEQLQIATLRSMEVLYSISSLLETRGQIDRFQFQHFVRQALDRQPELQALSWNPYVRAECRSDFEKTATAQGFIGFSFRAQENAGGELVVEGEHLDYVPVFLIEPLDRNLRALGFDLNSDPVRRRSIEQARDTGKAVATAPVRLAQAFGKEPGFLVLLPVYDGPLPNTVMARRDQLRGFAVAVFRVADLVGSAIHTLSDRGIEAELFDESPGKEKLYGTVSSGNSAPDYHGRAVSWLEVAGRRWALVFNATPGFVSAQTHWQSWLILCGGLAFTFLTAAYLYGGWRRTCEVAAANAALQQEVLVRQRAEAAAAFADKAKSEFLASMSHEIRTPLNAILGYTQLMQRDRLLSEEQRDGVRGISASGHHLLGLINEVLDLSKIEAGRMELNPIDFDLGGLGASLAATFKPLCAQKRIGFRVEIDPRATQQVRGDEGKLRQVLINLLGNAVKFTTAGEVYLSISPAADKRWLFEVIDTGLGIPESELADIFKPFHQGSGAQHQGGTGLGLAIAQRQVDLLGGKLEIQSERGAGSRFYFNIPLADGSGKTEPAIRQVARLGPGSRVSALVVDDRRENRDVLGGMLSGIGCDVSYAATGAEAVQVHRELGPHIVFLDLLLPGITASETARLLMREGRNASMKIVAHSASPLTRLREEAAAAGCVDFLSKPFRSEQLYDCLQRHLGVSFEYAEPLPENDLPPTSNFSEIVLPEELCARLMVAAELHSTTALKAALQELRELGPAACELAGQIRHLMRS